MSATVKVLLYSVPVGVLLAVALATLAPGERNARVQWPPAGHDPGQDARLQQQGADEKEAFRLIEEVRREEAADAAARFVGSPADYEAYQRDKAIRAQARMNKLKLAEMLLQKARARPGANPGGRPGA